MRIILTAVAICIYLSCQTEVNKSDQFPSPDSNLKFKKLAGSWDEGIPLGNGMLGALIWEKEKRLRFSLDRADLWDLRPMENIDKPEWRYSWVK